MENAKYPTTTKEDSMYEEMIQEMGAVE